MHLSPYNITTSDDGSLLIRITRGRERYMRWFYAIVPWMFLAIAIISTFMISNDMPGWYFLLPLLSLYISVAFIYSSWHLSLECDRQRIRINTVRFYKERKAEYQPAACREIIYHFSSGRTGGYFYKLILNNGKSVTILAIPRWDADSQKADELAQLLTNATGLQVKKEL